MSQPSQLPSCLERVVSSPAHLTLVLDLGFALCLSCSWDTGQSLDRASSTVLGPHFSGQEADLPATGLRQQGDAVGLSRVPAHPCGTALALESL